MRKLALFFLIGLVCLFSGCKSTKFDVENISSAENLYFVNTDLGSVLVKETNDENNTKEVSYKWVKNSRAPIHDKLVIQSKQSNNGRWIREIEDFLDVSFFDIDRDGKELCDTKLQSIIETLNVIGTRKLFFPKGTYLVGQLDVHAGFHIKGEENTLWIKPPKSAKFSRMITSVKNIYSSHKDSEPLIIENIDFDGRRLLQGNYKKYELEHQAIIFLHASKAKKGKLKCTIKNCNFKEGVGDAICVYNNVDVEILDITAENVFRGGITIGGGYSIIKAENVKAFGDVHPTGIDVEVDGIGYGNTYAVDFYGEDFELAGDFDLGLKDRGNVRLNNIRSEDSPFNVHTPNGDVIISNSNFKFRKGSGGTIIFPSNTTFTNTVFEYDIPQDSKLDKPINILWNTSYRECTNLRLTFNECTFISLGKKVIGLYNSADFAQNNNVLTIKDCKFKGNFTANVDYHFGGTLVMENTYLEGDQGVLLKSLEREKAYAFDAKFNKIKHAPKLKTPIVYEENVKNKITHDKSIVPISKGTFRNGKTIIVKE